MSSLILPSRSVCQGICLLFYFICMESDHTRVGGNYGCKFPPSLYVWPFVMWLWSIIRTYFPSPWICTDLLAWFDMQNTGEWTLQLLRLGLQRPWSFTFTLLECCPEDSIIREVTLAMWRSTEYCQMCERGHLGPPTPPICSRMQPQMKSEKKLHSYPTPPWKVINHCFKTLSLVVVCYW